jgi:hypothetical protein
LGLGLQADRAADRARFARIGVTVLDSFEEAYAYLMTLGPTPSHQYAEAPGGEAHGSG